MRTSFRLLTLSLIAGVSAFAGTAMADASVALNGTPAVVAVHAPAGAAEASVIPVKCKNPADCSATLR